MAADQQVQILPPTAVLVPAAVVQEKRNHDDRQIEWLAHNDCPQQFRTDSSPNMIPRTDGGGNVTRGTTFRFLFQEQGSLVLIFMGH